MFLGGVRKTSDCPIGIDVGDHTVRMLQLTRDGDRYVALAAASRPLGRDVCLELSGDACHQAGSNAVREMFSAGRFLGDLVKWIESLSWVVRVDGLSIEATEDYPLKPLVVDLELSAFFACDHEGGLR